VPAHNFDPQSKSDSKTEDALPNSFNAPNQLQKGSCGIPVGAETEECVVAFMLSDASIVHEIHLFSFLRTKLVRSSGELQPAGDHGYAV
jgi:hypothetical protein